MSEGRTRRGNRESTISETPNSRGYRINSRKVPASAANAPGVGRTFYPRGRSDMDDVTAERWLPVPGYEGLYLVSDLGHIRSLRRMTPAGWRGGRSLRTPPRKSDGYPQVALFRDGHGRTVLVHALVASAFLGPRPPGQEVRHLDGDASSAVLRDTDGIQRLAYGTRLENQHDSIRHGTKAAPPRIIFRGTRNPSSKLTEEIVRIARDRNRAGESQTRLAREYGVAQAAMRSAIIGQTWGWVA
jgi:hypothetical protein